MSRPRVPFDQDDDRLLIKYIATYNPEKRYRLGNVLYKRLVENADGKWPWSNRHSWQSWRERYKDNEDRFDFAIKQYQKRKGIKVAADSTSKSTGTEKKVALSFMRSVTPSQGNGQHQLSESNPTEAAKQERTRAEEVATIEPSVGTETGVNRRDELGSADESTIRRKRKDNELSTPGHSKRQRIENDEDAPGQSKSLTQGPTQTPLPVRPTQARRTLELLSSFKENSGAFDQNNVLDLLFEVLDSRPEEKQEVIELVKSRLPELPQLPSSNGERQQQILPRLEEDDYNQMEESIINNAMPGSLDKAGERMDEHATYSPLQEQRTGGAVDSDTRPLIDSGSAPIHKDAERRIPSASTRPSAQSRHRVSNKPLGEDFFKSPSPSPVKTGPIKPVHPEHASSAREVQTSSDARRGQLPKRDPPQFVNGPFRNTITLPRKQSLSPGKAPDVDTGSDTSDTEIIPDDDGRPVSVMNNAQAPMASWPPERNKKYGEKKAIPVPARGTMGRSASPSVEKSSLDMTAQKVTTSTTKIGPQASEESPQIGVTSAKSIRTSSDRTLHSHSFRESHSGASRGHLKEPKAPVLERHGQTVPTESEAKGPTRTAAAMRAPGLSRNAEPMRTTAKISSESSIMSKGNGANKPERSRDTQVKPQRLSEGGPLPLRGSAVRSVPVDDAPRTENILAWRSEAQVSDGRDENVSLMSMSDPFLTTEHAKALRRLAKGKAKEQSLVNMGSSTAEAETRAARRKTFGGLPTRRPPEIDLRKRALRSSVTSNLPPPRRTLSFSPLLTQTGDKEEKEDDDEGQIPIPKRAHRASVAATIDLSQEFPSPDLEIPSSDTAFIMRAGVQVLLQAIAQNHSVSEELVRGIYEELLDLQATDRIVAKMRRAAEQVVEVELERAKENKRRSSHATTPESEALPSPNHQAAGDLQIRSGSGKRNMDVSLSQDSRAQPVLSRRYSGSTIKPVGTAAIPQSTPTIHHRTASTSILSPEKHAPEVSIVSASRARTLSESRRRHSELFITPADDDPTYVRLRSQYVPPSASRAARVIRQAARRSSGLVNSPLNGFDEGMGVDVASEEEDKKEEEEVTLALTPARFFNNDNGDESWEGKENNAQAEPNSALPNLQKSAEQSRAVGRESSVPNAPLWTIEEDGILLGEDEEAIKAIIANRGKLAVRLRMAELAQ